MVRRIPRKLVVLFFCFFALSSIAENPDGILVSYSFDDDNIHTGPDTFTVFQNSKGRVSLTDFLSTSGYQSVEIRDVADDHDFPELQGYFPLQKDGVLYFHFSFLIVDTEEEFNIALAGPRRFGLKKDGIAFWLSNKNGHLVHYSDSIPKKLFPINASYWYTFDLTYYIDDGIYDLTIREEGNELPIVELLSVKNAANQPGSSIDKFSFIGDLWEDVSNVVYYVDDVIIGTDKEVYQEQFIAPGRRKLFIDLWNEHRRKSHGKMVCLPTIDLSDFNIPNSLLPEFKKQGAYEFINEIFRDEIKSKDQLGRFESSVHDYLQSIYLWHAGCNALERSEFENALSLFQEANIAGSRLIELSEIMAYAALKSWDEVNFRLGYAYADWAYDARYDIALAMIYFARGDKQLQSPFSTIEPDYTIAPDYSQEIHDFLKGVLKTKAHRKLKQSMNVELYHAIEPYIIAEQQFAYLIWDQSYDRAYKYAESMLDHLNAHDLPAAIWLERLGDAAFLSNNYQEAIGHYEQSLSSRNRQIGAITKLSDIYFLLGDLEKERIYRERIYGHLGHQ